VVRLDGFRAVRTSSSQTWRCNRERLSALKGRETVLRSYGCIACVVRIGAGEATISFSEEIGVVRALAVA